MAAVTDAAARDDADWFGRHEGRRRYRARISDDRIWIIRRRGSAREPVLLRTWTMSLPEQTPDTDAALRVAWFNAAWPELEPDERKELIKRARERERSHG